MKVRIVIDTTEIDGGTAVNQRRSEVWSGELELLRDVEYLTRISVIADGEPQPICQVPFALGMGHYVWISPKENWPEDPEWVDTEPRT